MGSVADRVKETTSSTGTGNLTLDGAAAGFQSFNAAFGLNKDFYYCCTNGTDWEVGEAYLTGSTTLVRKNVEASSNSNNPVNWSSGPKDIFCTLPAYEHQTKGKVVALATNLAMM